MAITSANQLELLQTAEAVAREKMIDPELVIQAMEDSLARAAKSRYGAEMDIRVKIDRKTGRASFTRVRTVVEDDAVENHHAQITAKQAKTYLADPQLGDEVIDEVPPVDLGRIAAQSAKQVILQKVREAERDRQFEEFKDRKGTIINGAVKRGRHFAPEREDRPRSLPHRRPHPLLHQGRPPRTARPAGLPVAHRPAVHGRALQDGSAGNL